MSSDIKGVFVRLPLSGDTVSILRKHIPNKNVTNDELINAIRAIGTPVTGGDLYPVGYTSEDAIGGLATGIYSSVSIFREKDDEHYDIVSLIRQSDAQSQIAALEAEVKEEQRISNLRADAVDAWLNSCAQKDQRIAELEEELSGFRAGLSELIAKEVAALKGGAA